MRGARISWLAIALAVGVAAPASADIIAAVDVPNGTDSAGCPAQWDLALIDAATGNRTSLPAGINTADDELHPSISSLGTRLTFSRVNESGGTTRIIAADLGTGQQADLFNAFQAQQLQPDTPSLTPDAGSVLMGARFQAGSGSSFTPVETVTPLSNFPGGPFSHNTRSTNASFSQDGNTSDPVERSDGLLAATVRTGSSTFDVLLDTGGGAFKLAAESGATLRYPVFSDPTTDVVVFQRDASGLAQLAFRPVGTFGSATSTDLPPLVNAAGTDALHPAFTPDGRYLGFLRFAHGGDRHLRLFVFDTATQMLVNPNGIDLGNVESFACRELAVWSLRGGLSLRETFQLVRSTITFTGPTALVSFQLNALTGVGLLVQRVVGHHRLFGHRVPKLRVVGRVPLGQFRRGHHRVHWHLRVNGHRLRAGTYLVTPRLVNRRGVIHELGKPRVLHVRS